MTVRSALRTVAIALVVASLVAVGGCAAQPATPDPVALSAQQGWPDSAPGQPPFIDTYPTQPVGWVAPEGDRFWLVTWGSGSCVFVATEVEAVDAFTVAVRFEQAPAEGCTDDLAPRAHEFAVPEGVDGPLETAEVTVVENAFAQVVDEVRQTEWTVDLVGGWFVTIAASIEPGLGEGVPAGDPESFAARVLVRDGSVVSLVTYGSSSCPFLPTAAEMEGGVLAITAQERPAGACTADMAPTTSMFRAPSGFDAETVTTARVTLDDGVSGETVETVSIERLG